MRTTITRLAASITVTGLAALALAASPATAVPSAYDAATASACESAVSAIASVSGNGGETEGTNAYGALATTLQGLAQGLSNADVASALNGVASAAAEVAVAIQADNGIDPSFQPYNNSLQTLWTACAQVVVTDHSLNVKKFKEFTYQTGQVVGLPAIAAKYASIAIASMVGKPVAFAKKANKGSCLGKQKQCGYFVQTLTQDPCVDGFICVRQQWGLLAVGANSGQDVVNTLALGAQTGTAVGLATFVPAAQQKQFLASLNAAVTAQLKKEGLAKDPFWKPNLKMKDVTAWLPEPDGMHVWFDKYAVAPGYMGVVSVVVPLPSAG